MLPGRKYTPEEVLRILASHKWLVAIPFVVCLALALGVASQILPRYRSETLIMVMPQRISTDILPQMVNDQIEDRLPSISDQIMSRSRLERIIADYDLYSEARAGGMIMEDVVAAMRKDIVVGISSQGKQSFRVSYQADNPNTSFKVTERLASLYIEENLKDKDNLAQSTSAFLESELESARGKLLEAEKRLEEYKKQYAGQLPQQADSNQQAIASAQLQLQTVGQTINRARERRMFVQQQLSDAQTTPAAMVSDGNPATVASGQTAAQKLEAAEAALALAKQRYTPDHPDIRSMERTIRDLRAKADAEAREPQQARTARPQTAAELARQRKIRDLESELAVIDQQIASGEREERTLKDSIGSYQGKLNAVPTREAELIQLNRDYTTLDASYKELLKKKEASELAANVERRQIGETFRIIDPPTVPQRPYNQMRRLQVVLGGAAAGLFLGLAMIGFLEYKDSTFKDEEDVVRVLSLPVLATVPVMGPPQSKPSAWRKKGTAALVIGTSVLSAAAALWRLQF